MGDRSYRNQTDYRIRDETYCLLYKLDEFWSLLRGKLRGLGFLKPLIAQELFCQV